VLVTRTLLYVVLLIATLLLGMAEVLRDNASVTIIPAIVDADSLEQANGRMWSTEGVMNTFLGPPLGALLVGVAFALPFFVDAGSFFAAAALVALIPGSFRARSVHIEPTRDSSWRTELREGVRWLWAHELLRPMAIILGLMNAAGMVSGATFVLFAQEVMHTSPLVFSILGFGGALGGIVAGQVASAASKRFGSGTCLAITMLGGVVLSTLIGAIAFWPVVLVLFAVEMMLGMLWNVITVSLRQRIIPEHLLGRVNSVYRFFALGMMPIGAALGGITVLVVDSFASRGLALRSTWFVNAGIHLGLFVLGRRYLTTPKIEAARVAARGPDDDVQSSVQPSD
jgi:MFS family permease